MAKNVRSKARLLIRNLRWGCGDNSCEIQPPMLGAMGTNGGCRCYEKVVDAIEEIVKDSEDVLWTCRRCEEEYEGDNPNHDEQRLCRPDTPHDWSRIGG